MSSENPSRKIRHVPILVAPIVEALIEPFRRLEAREPHWIIDCTLGGGGHTAALLEALSHEPGLECHKVLAIDQDAAAVDRARGRFADELASGRLELSQARISELPPLLEGRAVLGILADLGFSSDQIEDPARGLSFQLEGPLDMRLDPSRGVSCGELLARVDEQELADVIWRFGEERYSRRIASAIVNARRQGMLPSTTRQLAELIARAVPPFARHGRIHPATRSFQALRILVNHELEELDCLLNRVILFLKPGGRVAILSFHSLEDRKVKHAFKNKDGPFRLIAKKPIEADEEEVRRNPRSRSAKLRVAERF